MKDYILGAILAFTGTAVALSCQNVTVPVTISATNSLFNIPAPATNIDVTNFILDITQVGASSSQPGSKTVSGIYKIAGTLCNPQSGQANTVQLLTHGIGFDRTYWDYPYNNYNYSYTRVAVDQYGYSTFSWDRLGIGASQHGEPINEIQAQFEVEALHALTVLLRQGKIPGQKTPFKKVAHVGHSFGSIQSYALTVKYPNDSDGLGLTAITQNSTYIPYFALASGFVLANTKPYLSSYPNGYLAIGAQSGYQTNLFAPGTFDPEILDCVTAIGQPVAIGEILTLQQATAPINNYPGPVLLVIGERDLPYCGGNCLTPVPPYPNVPAAVQKSFPKAKNFKSLIVPGTGHALNLAYSHPSVFKFVNDYFVQNGVTA